MAQSALALESFFYRGDDQNRTDYVPGADVANGVIVDIGDRIGIVTTPGGIASGKMGSLATANVFKIKKAVGGGVTFAKGAPVYFNTSTRTAVAAAGTNIIYVGICDEAAVDGDNHVKTDINKSPVQSVDARLQALEDAAE
jgi:predicted RecA/RadA family phage recombinase